MKARRKDGRRFQNQAELQAVGHRVGGVEQRAEPPGMTGDTGEDIIRLQYYKRIEYRGAGGGVPADQKADRDITVQSAGGAVGQNGFGQAPLRPVGPAFQCRGIARRINQQKVAGSGAVFDQTVLFQQLICAAYRGARHPEGGGEGLFRQMIARPQPQEARLFQHPPGQTGMGLCDAVLPVHAGLSGGVAPDAVLRGKNTD